MYVKIYQVLQVMRESGFTHFT